MFYEMFVWLKSDLTPDQVKKELKDVEGLLEDCKKFQVDNLGRKKLAYKIKGLEDGVQLNIEVDCKPESILGLSTYLNRSDSVLRYMVTKLGASK